MISTENDFIEFLIFQNRYSFLENLIKKLPERFHSFSIVKDETGNLDLIDANKNTANIDDIIDYEIELSLNDMGYGYYMRFLDGDFFNKEDSGEIISDGIEFRLVKDHE